MGYSREQIIELEETINQTECDTVITGTPIDLAKIISINKPIVRANYELQEISKPDLRELITYHIKLN
jgi:predicted GTPase